MALSSQELIASDIHAYLAQHERKEILKFLTCGSVDDGKSTLIGRLLHDSKMIYEDQLDAIVRDSKTTGTQRDGVDLALLTDGLQAEREQGITIDVAYRYFSTTKRKFIIADTPGHEQYTRNMATGASTCDMAVILIDARQGVLPQTRRHTFIARLLGIRHLVVAVNKMDTVDYDEGVFDDIRADYFAFTAKLGVDEMHFIPISALYGDNVVEQSPNMPWYQGATLDAPPRERADRRGQGHRAFPPAGASGQPPRTRRFAATAAASQVAWSVPATRWWSCPRVVARRWTASSPWTAISTKRSHRWR